jgi:hypothetical protein
MQAQKTTKEPVIHLVTPLDFATSKFHVSQILIIELFISLRHDI